LESIWQKLKTKNNQMKRSLSLVFLAIVFVQQVFAQSLEDGKKFMYYERFNSAKDVFQKLASANPSNAEAAYWLGQAYLGLEDAASAKKTYQAALQGNPTSALLQAAMGQIQLIDGNTADARNNFDMAVNNSKSKDIEVLHAVGRANAYTKAGDATYGVTQLLKATTLKGFKDANVWVTIGDLYRKLVNGGEAVVAFKNALSINPTLAAAKHKEGLIYESQKNREFFLPAYEEAVRLDPNYGPAHYSLYVYWYFRDVAKAETHLNNYINVIDADPQNDYYKIDLKYASQKFSEAISMSDAMINKVGAGVVKPRIYRLKAYSYKSMGEKSLKDKDTVTGLQHYTNAKASIDEFFKKAKAEDVVPKDYELMGDIASATTGSETQAYGFYEKAMSTDTAADNKALYLQKAVDLAKRQKDKKATAYWLEKQYNTKKTPSNVDLYNLGRAFFDAGGDGDFSYYRRADSTFGVYTTKYPDQAFGYYWQGRSRWSIDTTMANGMANSSFEKFIQVATTGKDSVSFRPQIKVAMKYFVGYNIFVKKDYKAAIDYCNKILAIDPLDSEAKEYIKQLSGRQAGVTTPATTQPKTTTTKPAVKKPAAPAPKKK
jgi:tetratricopeptide (TPR) repeat protein